MQRDTLALQVSRRPPRRSRIVKGEIADCIGLSLTLPKSYLATFETPPIHRNKIFIRFTWSLVFATFDPNVCLGTGNSHFHEHNHELVSSAVTIYLL